MATWEDISDGRRLSGRIVVTVTDIERKRGDSLDWELDVKDKNGRKFQIQIWSTHDVDKDWNVGHRYELNEALGKIQSDGSRILSSTADLEVTDLETTDDDQVVKLLAISDTHFGYKYRDDYPCKWHADADGVASFHRAAKLAIRRDVDAIILAGDVFDDQGTVEDEDLDKITNTILKLHKHFIPIYYILGNHETECGTSLLKEFEYSNETIHLTPEGHRVYDSSVGLYGVDQERSTEPPAKLGFPSNPDTTTNILVMHHDLSPVREEGDVDLNEITANGPEFDFVISGDLHDAEYHWWGETRVLYTGATDHISRKYEENNPSAWLLTICDGDVDFERCPLDSVA